MRDWRRAAILYFDAEGHLSHCLSVPIRTNPVDRSDIEREVKFGATGRAVSAHVHMSADGEPSIYELERVAA